MGFVVYHQAASLRKVYCVLLCILICMYVVGIRGDETPPISK